MNATSDRSSAQQGLRDSAKLHRVEVWPRIETMGDPLGTAVARDARATGIDVKGCASAQVYLIKADLTDEQLRSVCERVLVDPVVQSAVVGAKPSPELTGVGAMVEVHPLPGVMDPAAASVSMAIQQLLGVVAQVSTGTRYDLLGATPAQAKSLGEKLLANPVIQRVTTAPYHPSDFAKGVSHEHAVRRITITTLNDAQLEKLSREAHLFLSLDEMKAIQDEYRRRGEEPREIELETLAQTWSEHCVHKTLKSKVTYKGSAATDPIVWTGRPGHSVNPDGSVTINNLLKSTVAAATFELIKEGVDWTLSVFTDNSGVIALDENFGVCIKVETHNHPSAIEPYGGSATGIGGCIRDVIGTGLGARPIASTDVFCVAPPDLKDVPTGCLPPRRILTQVVAGVRDYGNRMGIPTVSGGVYFDENYVGNPLVYCGCIGLIPRKLVKGHVKQGDRIIALGGRTGRDGIHGATFSSAELEHSAADEFSHAVQIGNAITEKQTLDAIMRARDEDPRGPLYNAMTDCGAGGFSSAVGEMGGKLGAEVNLERAPLKYPGLSSTEIWISEAQERMVLAVPPENVEALRKICEEESVEMADLGSFGTPGSELVLRFKGEEVGRMSMHFLHEGIPTPTREAAWSPASVASKPAKTPSSRPHAKDALAQLLSHPNIASKHWIIRQYDHEVRGGTVLKPLVGRSQRGPGDGSVIEPIPGSGRGIAISQGLQTGLGDPKLAGAHADAYLMTLAAIDECVRNLVCVGADPDRIAILDNFCWPSCKKPENLATLVRAAEGCYDGAKAYRTPFVSGKDSLNNQFTTQDGRTIEIPPTLLITGMGIVPDVSRCVSSDAKFSESGSVLLLIGAGTERADAPMGGSHYQRLFGLSDSHNKTIPLTDLVKGPLTAKLISKLVREGVLLAAHDVSDGGVITTIAEMLIGGSTPQRPLGAMIDLPGLDARGTEALGATDHAGAFWWNESPSRYVVEVQSTKSQTVVEMAQKMGLSATVLGNVNTSGVLAVKPLGLSSVVGDLTAAWRGTLDW